MKRMTVAEFRAAGLLQEVNRQFLHPLGLALEVIVDNDTGAETFGEVWDYRDDPEGIVFVAYETPLNVDAILEVDRLRESKRETREKLLGSIVQPVDRATGVPVVAA